MEAIQGILVDFATDFAKLMIGITLAGGVLMIIKNAIGNAIFRLRFRFMK